MKTERLISVIFLRDFKKKQENSKIELFFKKYDTLHPKSSEMTIPVL